MVSPAGISYNAELKRDVAQNAVPRARPNRLRVLRWLILLIAIAAFWALKPLWPPLVLAAWTAIIVRPLHEKLGKKMHRRKQAAGVITVLLVILALAPFIVVGLSLFGDAITLIERLSQSKSGAQALHSLTAAGTGTDVQTDKWDVQRVVAMARSHGSGALGAARTMFGAATALVIGIVIFVYGFFTFLVHGNRIYHWVLDRSPIPRASLVRFAEAFAETGRGLLIGVGLTALLQGIVAGIGYIVLGVPQALVLALLTMMAALIPSVGSGLVWVPVTVMLAVTGRSGAAVALLVIGCIVSLSDNFARPALSRFGKLEMPTFLLFASMLGGIGAFGAWGLITGPLFVRLACVGLDMLKESRAPAAEVG
jgi:predicted PurR-regulated permease PerM